MEVHGVLRDEWATHGSRLVERENAEASRQAPSAWFSMRVRVVPVWVEEQRRHRRAPADTTSAASAPAPWIGGGDALFACDDPDVAPRDVWLRSDVAF